MKKEEYELKRNKLIGEIISFICGELLVRAEGLPIKKELLIKRLSDASFSQKMQYDLKDTIDRIINTIDHSLLLSASGVRQDNSEGKIIAGFREEKK